MIVIGKGDFTLTRMTLVRSRRPENAKVSSATIEPCPTEAGYQLVVQWGKLKCVGVGYATTSECVGAFSALFYSGAVWQTEVVSLA